MPNRILRDWTDSDKVNSISVHAERFFVRLIMKVDDYGCFYADPRLLKANLFPLLLDGVREADIPRWMAECQKAGLIVLYEAEGRCFLQIVAFKQRLRTMNRKFPAPPDDGQLTVTCQTDDGVKLKRNETETKRSEYTRAHEGDLKKSNLFRQPVIPSKNQVLETFISLGGTKEMAKSFWEKYEATGWFLNGSPVTNFQSLASRFVTTWKGKDEQKNNGSPGGPTLPILNG